MKVQTTGRILLYSLFRRRRMILGLTLSILGTILLGSLLWPPSYEATSGVLIKGRDLQELLFTETKRAWQETMFIKPQEEVNSEIEIIRSRPVLERVVGSLKLQDRGERRDVGFWGAIRRTLRAGLKPVKGLLVQAGLVRELSGMEAFEAAVTRLGEQLRVEPAADSQIVRISYRDQDPMMASQVVNRVAEEYLQQRLTIHLNRAESSFYAEQLKTVEGELGGLQDQLEAMKREEGIVSFAEQSKALLKKLETFDLARATIQKEIISKRSKVEGIQDLRRADPALLIPLPEIAQDVQIQDLENKLINLRYQLETLRQRYTEESRQVVTARDQLDQLQAQIRNQVSRLLEREVAELRKLQAEEQALTQMIRSLKAEMEDLPAQEVALANLEKAIEDKQAALTVLRKRYQDGLTAQATDFRLQNAKIVSLASIPLKPAAPNLPLNLALGLVLALVVAFSSAFFVEYWDDSMKVPEDVERHLGLPVFASIPEL
ncbi:MAG: hypothetical protein L0191_01765 [Acidobacteria bacterium]|nr:hypothetical protein [Acidobacteriota bacterium]